MKKMKILLMAILISHSSCTRSTKVYPPLAKPNFDIDEVRADRARALAGDVFSIGSLQVWASTGLDDAVPGKKETVEFWNGKLNRGMEKRGIHNYCGPNAGIYEGREARELVKP